MKAWSCVLCLVPLIIHYTRYVIPRVWARNSKRDHVSSTRATVDSTFFFFCWFGLRLMLPHTHCIRSLVACS